MGILLYMSIIPTSKYEVPYPLQEKSDFLEMCYLKKKAKKCLKVSFGFHNSIQNTVSSSTRYSILRMFNKTEYCVVNLVHATKYIR